MLEHGQGAPLKPKRVVVIGAGGFVGGAVVRRLTRDGVPAHGLTRKELDLLADGAADRLTAALDPDDSAVFVSALAPARTPALLVQNLRMAEAVGKALAARPVAHVVYISSDAVYADDANPVTERSCCQPSTLHGMMHAARELMLKTDVKAPLAVLRPSLLYGARDPHNGYGPNRFRRLAEKGEAITLFGEGEEQRDHVLIDDVAEILRRVLMHRSRGVLNVATGSVHSFRDIAERIAALYDPPVSVRGSPRQGPMPHGGYRAFDSAASRQAFPDFRYTELEAGLAKAKAEHSQRM